MIRIGYVIDTIFAPTGGTEGQLLKLIGNLDRKQFEPHLYCLRSSSWLEEKFDLCPVSILDLHFSRNPVFIPRLWKFSRILKKTGIDVIQTHFRDANAVGILAARLADVKRVISTRRGGPYWKSRPGLMFLRGLNRNTDLFIANCRRTRDRTVREEGVDPERVSVIYNGLDTNALGYKGERSSLAIRRKLGIARDAPVVGLVANLRPVKGIDVFLKAAERVVKSIKGVQFLIIGEGPEEDRLKQLARSLGIANQVYFLGDREDIPDLLQAFDIGVLSSHSESFSNAILEYLANGMPAVVTDVGGAREAVKDGVNGFVVPPGRPDELGEKIEFLLHGTVNPREWVRDRGLDGRFTIPEMISAYEQTYFALIQDGRVVNAREEGAPLDNAVRRRI